MNYRMEKKYIIFLYKKTTTKKNYNNNNRSNTKKHNSKPEKNRPAMQNTKRTTIYFPIFCKGRLEQQQQQKGSDKDTPSQRKKQTTFVRKATYAHSLPSFENPQSPSKLLFFPLPSSV